MRSAEITAVIPVRDRPDLLDRAIRSVAAQTHPVARLVVVDDASAQPVSADALRDAHPTLTIEVIRNDTNVGPALARSKGWDSVTTRWVAFLDSDDEWLPGKLASQLAAAERSSAIAVVCGYQVDHQGGGSATTRSAVPARPAGPVAALVALRGGPFSTSTFLVDSPQARQYGVAFDPSFPALEDLDLLVQLAGVGTVVSTGAIGVHKYAQAAEQRAFGTSAEVTGRVALLRKYDTIVRRHRLVRFGLLLRTAASGSTPDNDHAVELLGAGRLARLVTSARPGTVRTRLAAHAYAVWRGRMGDVVARRRANTPASHTPAALPQSDQTSPLSASQQRIPT